MGSSDLPAPALLESHRAVGCAARGSHISQRRTRAPWIYLQAAGERSVSSDPLQPWERGETRAGNPSSVKFFSSKGYVFFVPHRRGQGRSPNDSNVESLRAQGERELSHCTRPISKISWRHSLTLNSDQTSTSENRCRRLLLRRHSNRARCRGERGTKVGLARCDRLRGWR